MRQTLCNVITDLDDERVWVLLAGVSNFLFRDYPRTLDVGVREQSLVAIAAGMSLEGRIPICLTMTPFLAERALEPVKMACLNKAPIKVCTIGGSFDYAESGPSHHCHSDIASMCSIPGMEVYWPGNRWDAKRLLQDRLTKDAPAYFRLSDFPNEMLLPWMATGKGHIVQQNRRKNTVVVTAGPLLGNVYEACKDLPVSILYYNVIKPLDRAPLAYFQDSHFIVVSECHGLIQQLCQRATDIRITDIGLLDMWADCYGTVEDCRKMHRLDPESIRREVECRL